MNNSNLVYKTYDISTDKEYTTGTRLNLSGVRTIKLLNRPSGVEVWISTDSNGTNLFPLINRGDGWELSPEHEPLYNLYVFTKGTNPQDTLKLSYTGEKNFFIFGNSSVERIGEIESLGNQAQIDINNAIFNYYNRVPITATGKIFESFYYSDYQQMIGNLGQTVTRLVGFPLSSKISTISELKLENNEFYRINILGHWDLGNDVSDGGISNSASIRYNLHLTLFNQNTTNPITFTEIEDSSLISSTNLYRMDKGITPAFRFNLLAIKYQNAFFEGGGGVAVANIGETNINLDIIVSGATLNKYSYFGVVYNFDNWINRGTTIESCHVSILTTISQAYSNVKARS